MPFLWRWQLFRLNLGGYDQANQSTLGANRAEAHVKISSSLDRDRHERKCTRRARKLVTDITSRLLTKGRTLQIRDQDLKECKQEWITSSLQVTWYTHWLRSPSPWCCLSLPCQKDFPGLFQLFPSPTYILVSALFFLTSFQGRWDQCKYRSDPRGSKSRESKMMM